MSFDPSIVTREVQRLLAVFLAHLPRLVAAMLIVVGSLFVARVLRWGVMRSLRAHVLREHLRLGRVEDGMAHHAGLQTAVARLVYAVAIAVTLLVAATVAFPSFTVGSLIQLLGVGGVVFGFAFKDILQNFLAGILLLLTNPFRIGDQIIVDSYEGTVEQIQSRATWIRTYDHRRVVVPNADLFTKSVTVNTAFAQRRMIYDLTLGNDPDIAKANQVIADVLTKGGIAGVAEDPVADVLVLRITGSTVTFRLLWWSASERGEYLVVQDRVLRRVRDAVRGAGLVLA